MGCGSRTTPRSTQHQGPIDAVVSDMVMPGMSGPELVEKLRALRPELKVLYVSGYSADIVGQRVALQPGTAFLQKPFRANALLLKLRDAGRVRAMNWLGSGGVLIGQAGSADLQHLFGDHQPPNHVAELKAT